MVYARLSHWFDRQRSFRPTDASPARVGEPARSPLAYEISAGAALDPDRCASARARAPLLNGVASGGGGTYRRRPRAARLRFATASGTAVRGHGDEGLSAGEKPLSLRMQGRAVAPTR